MPIFCASPRAEAGSDDGLSHHETSGARRKGSMKNSTLEVLVVGLGLIVAQRVAFDSTSQGEILT